jgi:N-(2-amino-2-carboxyethyl)-L-glutamate synthase
MRNARQVPTRWSAIRNVQARCDLLLSVPHRRALSEADQWLRAPSVTVALQPPQLRALTYSKLARVRVRLGTRSRSLGLKLEETNPTGSVKYRTAIGLLAALDAAEPLLPGTRVVESTSGNLGIALAALLSELGCRLVAVMDPKSPARVRELIRGHWGEIVEVDTRDEHGGYLLTRLATVRRLRAEDPSLRWTDQYSNPANPAIHRQTLAVELIEQTAGALDAVLVPVSTGGTLAGVSDGLRSHNHPAAVYAIDAAGSLATCGSAHPHLAHPHLLTGIGATRKSSFLQPGHYTSARRVQDVLAFTICRILVADTGLAVGGSGGAAIAAFAQALRTRDSLADHRCPVALIADGGERYLSTFYDDGWLKFHGVHGQVARTEASLRRAGLEFHLGD